MNNKKINTTNLGELTQNLASADKRYANMSKRIQVIYWVLLPVYALLVIRHMFDNAPLSEILGSVCFMLAMLTFALLFRKYHKEYSTVDYALPTLVMLKKAAKRYKPFRREAIWALVAALFVDAGLALNHPVGEDSVLIQIIFGSALCFALLVGLVWWYISYKPLRDAALQLIREIEA